MADFLPKNTIDPNAPNWTGASQKPDASNYRANRTMETLFSGVGNLVGNAADAAYTGITNHIKETWNSVVDPVRGAQGVDAMTDGANVGVNAPGAGLTQQGKPAGNNIPAPVAESFAERAQKLKAAFDDRRVGDAYYYAQLNALVRQVKAQYPGFHEEVDAIVQKSTGVVPANALRNATLAELERGRTEEDKARKDEQKKIDDLMRYATPQMLAEFQRTGKKPSLAALEAVAYPQIAEEQQLEAGKKRLAYSAAQGENTQDQAILEANRAVQGATEKIFKDALGELGGENSLMARALKGGTPLSEQETREVLGQFQAFRSAYEQQVRKIYEGYSGHIKDASKIDAAVKMYMGKLDSIEKALGSGDYTVAAMAAKNLQLSKDSGTFQLWNSSPGLRTMGIMASIPGIKEVMPLIINRSENNGMVSRALKDGNDFFIAQSVAGTNPNTGQSSITQALRHHAEANGGKVSAVPSAAAKDLIDTHVGILINEKTSPEIRANIAKDIFRDSNLLSTFTEKEKLYRQLTSPAVTAQMLKLKDSHPQAYSAYVDWAKRNFQSVTVLEGNKISASADERYLKIEFDPASNRFVPSLTPEGIKYAQKLQLAAQSSAGRQSMEQSRNPLELLIRNDAGIREYARTITTMNGMVENIAPILKAGGYDPGKEMQKLFEQRGIANVAKTPEAAGFWQRLGKSIGSVVKPAGAEATREPEVKAFGGMPLNFQTSSGDNLGSGRQQQTKPSRRSTAGQAQAATMPGAPAPKPVPGGLGATLGASENAFSRNDPATENRIIKSLKAQEILRQEPARVVPGKKADTRAQ